MVTATSWMKLARFTSRPTGGHTHVLRVDAGPASQLQGRSCHEAKSPADVLEMDLLDDASRPSRSFHAAPPRPALRFGSPGPSPSTQTVGFASHVGAGRGGGGEQQVAVRRAGAVQGAQGAGGRGRAGAAPV